MLLLALTSTTGMIRRMGGKRWQALHRLVYAAAVAGVLHYWWLVKADVSRPQIYALVVAALLGDPDLVGVPQARGRPGAGRGIEPTPEQSVNGFAIRSRCAYQEVPAQVGRSTDPPVYRRVTARAERSARRLFVASDAVGSVTWSP